MQILSEDILTYAFVPSDGSQSTAVKVMHRTTRQEFINNATISPYDNFRAALKALVAAMNPHPDHIPMPELLPFDEVKVRLPESTHDGEITRMTWNFTSAEWQYFAQCSNPAVSTWYVRADLALMDDE